MKLIREGRMGPPKSFKTGAVVGTYPKPMLVFVFDEGGLDIIPSRVNTLPPDAVKMNCYAEDIEWITPEQIDEYIAKPVDKLSPITAIDFNDARVRQVDLAFVPVGNSYPMSQFMVVLNKLVSPDGRTRRETLPWKTVVLDPVTGLSDIIMAHVAQANSNATKTAQLWAPMVGAKVQQVVSVMTTLPSHAVVIMHSTLEKNELTGMIVELPMIYSRYRDRIGAYLSQFFYATKQNGKPVVLTSDQGFVRGIGTRGNLPPVCQPDFHSLYGKDYNG